MNKKINVLHVIDQLHPYGGTPVKLLYQVQHASPEFVYTICCILDSSGLRSMFQQSGAEVITLGHWKNYDLRQLVSLVNIIVKNKIDIVHTHFARSNTYGRLASIISGKPVITSEHGIFRNTSFPIFILDNILNPFTSHNISNSYATLKSVRKTVRFNQQNMSVIYNGVPDTFNDFLNISREAARSEFNFKKDDFIILDVGSHIPLRCHETLFEAVARVRPHIQNLKVIQIGDGPEYDTLVKRVKEFHVDDIVFLWGYVDREKVHRLLCCPDIYVNPATAEGFGFNTVEAMLSQLPIICAKTGSLPELINHNKEGLLFEPKNEEELSQYILKLYHSKELRESLGEAARKRALEKFSVKQFVKAFEDKYLSMIK